MKKSWQEKLNNSKDLPKIVRLKAEAAKKWGGSTMYIPSPLVIDKIMKKVPKGKVITTDKIRKHLAKKNKTAISCPLTTGIFTWISAYAAEEEKEDARKAGKESPNNMTPYWRTLKSGGVVNEKYPGGLAVQKKLLESERHKVEAKGKNFVVKEYELKLAKL